MSTRILRPPLLFAALAAAACLPACVQYQDFDSAGHLRQQFTERVGPDRSTGIEVPYEITPELRAALEQRLRQAPSERSKINEVLRFIFEDLDLGYSLTPTRNAVQTWQTQ